MLRILYLAAGGERSTSMMRARALQRLGHAVTVVNLNDCLPGNIWLLRLGNFSGNSLWQGRVKGFIASRIAGRKFDVAWVDSGSIVGPRVVNLLHRHALRVVNYNHDDPTGVRDGRVWSSFKRSVPLYDLMVTVRPETEGELYSLGAHRVMRVWRSYDEVDHRPREITAADRAKWGSEVVFVGSRMPERDAFMAELVRRQVPLAIYGDFWPKARNWPLLKAVWRSPGVYGDDYAKAIQCSKIALGLLSKGNRDRHTTRTAEIPALGGLFCAERTTEHESLFQDGTEAVYWRDAVECAEVCAQLLLDEPRRLRISLAGRARLLRLNLGHENVLRTVLESLAVEQHPAYGRAGEHGSKPVQSSFSGARKCPEC